MGFIATKKLEKKLLAVLETLQPGSEEYSKVLAQYERITKCEANNSWIWPCLVGLAQTTATCVASTVQVKGVLKHEDRGNIVTTKSLGFAQKVPNISGNPKNSK